jgi:hypothetical protein
LHNKRIAIHAGARKVPKTEVRDLLVRLHSLHWRETGLIRDRAIELLERLRPTDMQLSAILCSALLGVPTRNADMERALGLPVQNDSDRDGHSNYGWPLTDIKTLSPPIPARGAQGFFKVTVPADVA